MMLAVLASFAQEESRSRSENNKWSIRKRFERREVQSCYISVNHEPIVSSEVWEKVQKVRNQRKRDRNIGKDNTMKS